VTTQTARAHLAGAPPDEARAARAARSGTLPLRRMRRTLTRLRHPLQVRRVAAHAATFQLLASIIAPFLAIHTAVDLGKRALAHTRAARHGPTACGLALIPLLPLSDEPIEAGAGAARVTARAMRAG
jgi:hypothetical protein